MDRHIVFLQVDGIKNYKYLGRVQTILGVMRPLQSSIRGMIISSALEAVCPFGRTGDFLHSIYLFYLFNITFFLVIKRHKIYGDTSTWHVCTGTFLCH